MGLLFKHKWIIVTVVCVEITKERISSFKTSDLRGLGPRGPLELQECGWMWRIFCFGARVPTDGGERLCGTVRKQLWRLLFPPQRDAAVGAKGHLRGDRRRRGDNISNRFRGHLVRGSADASQGPQKQARLSAPYQPDLQRRFKRGREMFSAPRVAPSCSLAAQI